MPVLPQCIATNSRRDRALGLISILISLLAKWRSLEINELGKDPLSGGSCSLVRILEKARHT